MTAPPPARPVQLVMPDEFHQSLITAMISATAGERRRLAAAYPHIADFLRDNGYPEMPGGRRPGADQGPDTSPCYDDLEAQLQCAMGDEIHPGWAPSIIEIIRHRHPDEWKAAVESARRQDTNRTEM